MPVYVRYSGWYVYFWTNEKDEPIHFHIAEGKPSENATKIWITKSKKAFICHNKSKIPSHKLNIIMKVIEARADEIIEKWKEYFGQISYYC